MPTHLPPNTSVIERVVRCGFAGALTLSGLIAPSLAYAVEDTPCAAYAELAQQPASSSPSQWLAALGGCQNDATFLATLGDLLNQQGRYQEASEHLERALLLNADLKGAQLSYAIALYGIGDDQAAQALLDALLADPSLPAHLRTALLKQKEWQRTPVLQTRFTLNARWGRDSNLLSAPNLTDLALTMPGQTVLLPLDTSYLARAGQYYRTDAQFELRRLEPNGTRWDFNASLHNRRSPLEDLAGANQLDAILERSKAPASVDPAGAPASLGHYVNAAASVLEARLGTRYATLGLGGGAVLAWNQGWAATCRTRIGMEVQARNYENNNLLSGRYTGLAANLACEPPQGAQWLLGLKVGRDTPRDSARPGGNQNQYGLHAAAVLPLATLKAFKGTPFALLMHATLNADLEANYYHDSSAYSPLLESGRTRVMERYMARLEYQQPLTQASYWVLGLEATHQRANIELFRVQSVGPYLAWRVSW